MEPWQMGLALKPLIALLFLALIVWPIKVAILWSIPDGKVKRILMFSWKV